MADKQVISAYIKQSLANDLARVADKQGISKSSVISLAIADYVAKVDKKRRLKL